MFTHHEVEVGAPWDWAAPQTDDSPKLVSLAVCGTNCAIKRLQDIFTITGIFLILPLCFILLSAFHPHLSQPCLDVQSSGE